MSTNSTNGPASQPGTRTRRHRQVSPHVLALSHRAQQGDRDASADFDQSFHDAVTRYVAARMRDSAEAVRCLERRALRRMPSVLVGAADSRAAAVTA